MSVFLVGPMLGGLSEERVQPSEMAMILWELSLEKLPFLFTSICRAAGRGGG